MSAQTSLDAEDTAPPPAKSPKRPRNAELTKKRILEAAVAEFSEHGFSGARMDAIALRSNANMRMLYHYYGSKEDLYLLVLEEAYRDLRNREHLLDLDHLPPREAMLKLFDFTYSYFANHPEVVSLWSGENLLRGRFLAKSKRAVEFTSSLLVVIEATLKRGEKERCFRKGIDPLQIYVSIVALSYFHLSNAYTLSIIFRRNLQSRKWRAERNQHAMEMFKAYLLR